LSSVELCRYKRAFSVLTRDKNMPVV